MPGTGRQIPFGLGLPGEKAGPASSGCVATLLKGSRKVRQSRSVLGCTWLFVPRRSLQMKTAGVNAGELAVIKEEAAADSIQVPCTQHDWQIEVAATFATGVHVTFEVGRA